MSRKDFELKVNTPISDILLDTKNPRIRDGSDQADCITRILRKEDHLKALMEDIAKNGLTTAPILVKPHDNKYVVMDGNRRITALKLLNEPNLCPNSQLKNFATDLKEKHSVNIISKVDVLSSTNDDAIAQEILSRHDGEQGGAGQVNWNAYLRTIFLMNNGHSAEYKRSAQYAMWAEEQGIWVDDEFPITALNRFFTQENIKELGFSIEDDKLKPNIAIDKVKQMAQFLFNDFYTKAATTDTVRTPALASTYVKTVRLRAGLLGSVAEEQQKATTANNNTGAQSNPHTPSQASNQSNTSSANTNSASATPTPFTPSQQQGTQQPTNQQPTPRPAPTPVLNSWNRNKLFGTKAPQIPVPSTETKVTDIVAEIRKLSVKDNPIAVAMLLRGLIELSDKFYRTQNKLTDAGKLGKNITASANHMHQNGRINASELDAIIRFSGAANVNDNLLHVESLQKIMHRETHNPNYQLVNTLWDNISPFVRTCWRS